MKLYTWLSNIPFLRKSYVLKFLFVAFLGIHIPLIGIVIYILFHPNIISPGVLFTITLILTLVATGITLWILRKLVQPMEIASEALVRYGERGIIPSLPTRYTDEVGILLTNLQMRINENEDLLSEKKDLISLLSHDLKNYASTPQFLARFILEEEPSDKIKNYAELILESTTHQLGFLESFVALLRQEEAFSRTATENQEYRLDEIIGLIEKVSDQKLSNKKLTFRVVKEVDKIDVVMKEEYLQRVLMNLIDNAIKFSYTGSEILLYIMEENDSVVFVVTDKGIGFENSRKDELFEKFSKLSRPGTNKEPSTGIGLYLCRKIVERSSGSIYAESEGTDMGSKFTVILKKRNHHVHTPHPVKRD